jgi:hypothetical protein
MYVYTYIHTHTPAHTGLADLVSELPNETAAAVDSRVFDLQLSLDPAALVTYADVC